MVDDCMDTAGAWIQVKMAGSARDMSDAAVSVPVDSQCDHHRLEGTGHGRCCYCCRKACIKNFYFRLHS